MQLDRNCYECGRALKFLSSHAVFCCEGCRKKNHNRSKARGLQLLSGIVNSTSDANVSIYSFTAKWRAEDEAAGRVFYIPRVKQ